MKLLVLGWYYSSNLGDAVICDCVADMLRSHYPQAQICIRDIVGHSAFPKNEITDLNVLDQQRRRQRLRILATRLGWDKLLCHRQWYLDYFREEIDRLGSEDCDAVVFAGGQMFMDDLALYVEALTARFSARNIPVFFNACGTGPSWSRAIRSRLGKALSGDSVKLVSCRDDTALVDRWCGKGDGFVIPTADPALEASRIYGVSRDPNAETVGLGVLFPFSLEPRLVMSFWRRLIRQLERQHIPWKLFTNGSGADTAFARKILNSLPELSGQTEKRLCPPPQTPRELVQTIAQFKSLISFRLHSHILACSLDIPTVALVWDRKVPLFFEKIGQPERCLPLKASPKRVLQTLEQAEKVGYDREKITAQSDRAQALLLDSLDGILRG